MSELNPQHPNNLSEPTKDPFDEFSFDDLMQMDFDNTATPNPSLVASTPAPTPSEVDFDNLFAFDDTPPPPVTPTPLSHTDLDVPSLDIPNLDIPNLSQPTTIADSAHVAHVPDSFATFDNFTTPDITVTDNYTTPIPEHDFLGSTPAVTGLPSTDFSTTPHTLPETTGINPIEMAAGVGVAGATAATLATTKATEKSKSALGGLFTKKEKTPKPAKEKIIKTKKEKVVKPASATPSGTTKKNNKLLPLLLGLLVIGGIGAWLFSQIMDKAPDPKPVAATPVAKPAPAPVAKPASAVAPVVATSATSTASAPMVAVATASGTPTTTTTTTVTQTTSSSNITVIKPEEILAKPIPQDPALAKEEMDKLSDQSARLAEQEKMMEDQLKMTKELSDKKAERIALLEQQIAQLEAQKGQAKQ